MTFQQLFQSVSFDELCPFLPKRARSKAQIGAYHQAYNIICTMRQEGEPNDEKIVIKRLGRDKRAYLSAMDCECDSFENNLTKEVILAEGVDIPLPHMAAICLWEQTFYGFSPDERARVFQFMREDADYQQEHGLTLPLNPDTLEPDGEFDPVAEADWERWRIYRKAELGLSDHPNL